MGSSQYEDLAKKAVSIAQENGFEAAYEYLDKYIEENPRCTAGYLVWGDVCTRLEEWNEALGYFGKAIELDPNNSVAYIGRSQVYFGMNDFPKAVADCTKTIEITPKGKESYFNRGHVYMHMFMASQDKDYLEKAFADYNKFIELDPDDPEGYFKRGVIKLQFDDTQNKRDAISDFTKVIKLTPDRQKAYLNRGLAYASENLKDFEKALADYNMSIKLDPNDPQGYAQRAGTNSMLGNTQEAINDYEKYLKLDPNCPSHDLQLIKDALKELKGGKTSKGCYVATCAYGSYDCPEVWTLRRFRDDNLSKLWFGKLFIRIYYAISPKIVELFGNQKWFNKICKPVIDKLVITLQNNGVENTPYCDKNVN